jgi:hypothetical protein
MPVAPMKNQILILAVLTAVCHAQTAKLPVSASDLAAKQQNLSLAVLEQAPPATAEAPVIRRASEQSLISQSEILNDGKHWTLVPKGAVLHVPQARLTNVGTKPVGVLLPWIDFLTKNPAWISTHETSFEQASGEVPLPRAKTDFWEKQDRVIIAVHQGGPVSVVR